ncbi:MAG: helix-turn-helix domain-containing protein [Hyphomicrobium sp.]
MTKRYFRNNVDYIFYSRYCQESKFAMFGGMAKFDAQVCPVARALSVVGERWSLLIIRDLLRLGPRKFAELEDSLKGISPNTLSARLKHLEDRGVITKRLYEHYPPRAEYVLTERGRQLGPIVLALKKWGEGVE